MQTRAALCIILKILLINILKNKSLILILMFRSAEQALLALMIHHCCDYKTTNVKLGFCAPVNGKVYISSYDFNTG